MAWEKILTTNFDRNFDSGSAGEDLGGTPLEGLWDPILTDFLTPNFDHQFWPPILTDRSGEEDPKEGGVFIGTKDVEE